MCCSVLQCVAVCCSVLQYVAVCCSVAHADQHSVCYSMLQCVAVCCSMLLAVCCDVAKVSSLLDLSYFFPIELDVENSHSECIDVTFY